MFFNNRLFKQLLFQKKLMITALMGGSCFFNSHAQGVIDSVRLSTQNNIAPIVTSHVLAPQPAQTIQLGATVFPAAASQTVSWSVPAGNGANATVNTNGLVTVPTQTQGLAWIKANSAADATKSDSLQLQVYCQPSHTNPINWFVIDTVAITGTTLANTVTALGNANAYQIFPESGSNTASLTIGNTYNLKSHVTFSYGVANTSEMSYSLWIDYNRNGIFEASEWTGIATSTLDSLLTGSFTIPANAVAGKTLMRVRSRIAGSINGPADACASFNGSGQTKDFIITLASGNGSTCNNTMPGTAVGSTGCVSFTYQGQQTAYTTVRASDGNVWLQQNLGNKQVGASKTDTLAYGHLFQWGRWDDGHQLRTAATGPVPTPNNPSGIGSGSGIFYTGSSTNAWWNGGNLSDTWSAASNSQTTGTAGCDPCKSMGAGWHLPTESEWAAVVNAEQITNTGTAHSSNLKLVVGGSRSFTDGGYSFVGVRGYYWSSTTSTTGGKYLYYSDAIVNAGAGNNRGGGAAVRCIYSQSVGVTAVDVTTQNNIPATITNINGTLQLQAAVLPSTVSQSVTWTVQSGAAFASVNNTGLVTAIANGTATVRATSVLDPTQYDEINVVINATNPCAPVSSFYENFDAPTLTCCNMGVVPECWNSISTAVGANQIISTTSPASGTNNIYQTGYGTGKISIVVMRAVNNINAGTHQFRFKVRANSGPGNLDFGYITDVNDATTFVTIQAMSISNSTYSDPAAERIFTVPATVPSNARLAIRNPGTSWAGFYWDDVYWEPVTTTAIQSVAVTTQNNVPATINTNGGTLQAVATVLPLTASQAVTWSIVPATGSASISTTGLITAQSNGTVYAKAISVADPTKADSLLVVLSNQVTPVLSLSVATQNNQAASITTNAGTLQIMATVLPAAANQNVSWSIVPVSGTATISAAGLVTAQTNGTVYAKAVSVADPTKRDSLLVTITNQVTPAASLSVATQSNQAATITTNAGILQMTATVLPATANQNVSWSIVPVSGTAAISATGLITAQTNGTVYAKAVSAENNALRDSLLVTISGQGNVGIKEVAKGLSFELLPNPAHNYFTVSLPKGNGTAQVAVISLDGRIVLRTSFEGKSKRIAVDSWSKGVYLIHLQTKEGYAIKKLEVE